MVIERIQTLLADLPRERTWVLPALLRVQVSFGYVSAEAIEAVARHLRLTASDVDGIAWGYPDLRRERPAGMTVRVCTGLSCLVAGADDLSASLERVQSDAGIDVGRADCLFACALAPVVAIGEVCHGRATVTSVVSHIRDIAPTHD